MGGLTPPRSALTEEFTGAGAPVGAWSTGGNLNTARMGGGQAGIQTSALVFGGGLPSPFKTETESYNGTSWTELNNLPTANIALSGAGSSTAALGFGGYTTPYTAATKIWNGTNWSDGNNMNQARGNVGGGGTTTSAIAFGGIAPGSPPPIEALTETYNGTNWTEVNNLNTARYYLTSSTQNPNTASLAYGGASPPAGGKQTVTELWNGTNWTEVNDLNTARATAAGGGITTSAICSTGTTPSGPTRVTSTEIWNGVSWAETSDMSIGSSESMYAAASNAAALVTAGEAASGSPAVIARTEEFNSPSSTTKVLTD